MAPPYEIRTLPRQPTVTIRGEAAAEKLPELLADFLPAVFGYLEAKGVTPVGPPFVRYHRFGETLEIEGGMPVAEPVEGEGRIAASELPSGDAAVGWHIGPYERLAESHAALQDYIAQQGRAASAGHWEIYWTDPGAEPDPEKWRTELVQPLAAQ